MSVDQLLLEQAAEGQCTLRFYQWSQPTLSLGYFQSFQQRNEHAESRPCPWLRRASGGGAILHHQELTYSFSMPDVGRSANLQSWLYDAFHITLIQALATFDVAASRCVTASPPPAREPFLCFQRYTIGDVLLNHHKIMGSAQRRHKSGILQHGSILLHQSAYAPQLPGIQELNSAQISCKELIDRWQPRLADRLSLQLHPASLSAEERQRAADIEKRRFLCHRWNQKR